VKNDRQRRFAVDIDLCVACHALIGSGLKVAGPSWRAGCVLMQNRYDLILSEPDPLHHPSLQQGQESKSPWRKNSVTGHGG
jgi:hypothetical protein